jgi:MFS transporter, DHA2 family, multidrug resistance protein
LMTSTSDLIVPLSITGVGLALLFVPLTTAALSNIPRHEMAGAAGVNSFVRQVGGSIGLSIFATLFTRFSQEASAGLASNISILRPEVAIEVANSKAAMLARGFPSDLATALTYKSFAGRAAVQGTVIGFDKTFILQMIAFIVVLPLLFFLKVKRSETPAHVEISVE